MGSPERNDYDPSSGFATQVYTQRIPACPGRRDRRRGQTALHADELHQLERRPPGLAGAALLVDALAGYRPAAGTERGVLLWLPRPYPTAGRHVGGLAHRHRGRFSFSANGDHRETGRDDPGGRSACRVYCRLTDAARHLPLLVSHGRKHGDPPAAWSYEPAGFRRQYRPGSAVSPALRLLPGLPTSPPPAFLGGVRYTYSG